MNPRMFTTQDKRDMLKRQEAKLNVKVIDAPKPATANPPPSPR